MPRGIPSHGGCDEAKWPHGAELAAIRGQMSRRDFAARLRARFGLPVSYSMVLRWERGQSSPQTRYNAMLKAVLKGLL